MCDPGTKQTLCLACFFLYQLVVLYGWIIFTLSSSFDIEIMYCPAKLTGKVFSVIPYNITDE